MNLLGDSGVLKCALLWRLMFGIAKTFVGLSEGMAKYGFLALSTVFNAFTGFESFLASGTFGFMARKNTLKSLKSIMRKELRLDAAVRRKEVLPAPVSAGGKESKFNWELLREISIGLTTSFVPCILKTYETYLEDQKFTETVRMNEYPKKMRG
ncbi:hypothetical protein QQ045_025719 [Rhodiola kirilowii]